MNPPLSRRCQPLLSSMLLGVWLLLGLAACTSESAADGTPSVSTAALPGPPGRPNPSVTDPSPRGYGPTGNTGAASSGGSGFGR